MRLIGKTKFSTKPERGPQTVLERVARCVSYATDECDLSLKQIRAIGVSVPGMVESSTGMVRMAPELSWEKVPLQGELMKLLAVPVRIENVHQLGTLGIYSHELEPKPASLVSVFLGPQISAGFIRDGRLHNLSSSLPSNIGFDAPERNVLGFLPHPLFQNFRSRDFRKALRKGNPAVREYLVTVAERAAVIVAQLSELLSPDVIALGGGILDEMKDEMLQIITGSMPKQTSAQTTKAKLVCSILGDLAGIAGAASWAKAGTGRQELSSEQLTPDLTVRSEN